MATLCGSPAITRATAASMAAWIALMFNLPPSIMDVTGLSHRLSPRSILSSANGSNQLRRGYGTATQGWQEIRAGRDVLISAPTGAGKTLAAF